MGTDEYYRGGIIEKIREAGETENVYGALVALGYFIPMWAVMFVIAIFVAYGYPNSKLFWLGYIISILAIMMCCHILIEWSLKKGKKANQKHHCSLDKL